MDLPWFYALPLFWLFVRLFLVIPLALMTPQLEETSKSPFGPSGGIRESDTGCFMILASGLLAAIALGGYAVTTAKNQGQAAQLVMFTGAAGFVGFILGTWIDIWLNGTVQPWISRASLGDKIPQIRGWLVDGSDQDKQQAAILLGHLRKQPVAVEYLPDLINAISSPNPEVRYFVASAIMSIVQHTHEGPRDMWERLVPFLLDPEVKVRAPIARALVEARLAKLSEVVRPMSTALMSDDQTAWGLVTYYLDAPGRFTHLAIPEIFESVAYHGERSHSSLELVFRWIDPAGMPALEEGLKHPSPHVQKLAAHGIARMGSVPYSLMNP